MVGVNRVGKGGDSYYSGESMVVDPLGSPLSQKDEEDVFTISLGRFHLDSIRSRLPFLNDADPFELFCD